jgi:hypothetical protein
LAETIAQINFKKDFLFAEAVSKNGFWSKSQEDQAFKPQAYDRMSRI